MQTDSLAPHQQTVEAALAARGADPQRGLSDEEVRARLERYGRNELLAEKPVPAWRKFVAQFRNFLVILLVIAAAISAAIWWFERESALPYEALAIMAIVLLNAVMGYVQESRAEASLAKLRAMSAAEATALRNGERRRVPAAELVPGDIVAIEEGDTIPADARLIHSTALQTAEAALTGESLPSSKDTDPVAADAGLGDRTNMVFSGTVATYG
ncbi:MAG TPA: HAD-IC family P-type ATPase, partial [Opitutus sp.]|nr:HAD-IC family P-type ATPase [Opitutus sp.]